MRSTAYSDQVCMASSSAPSLATASESLIKDRMIFASWASLTRAATPITRKPCSVVAGGAPIRVG